MKLKKNADDSSDKGSKSSSPSGENAEKPDSPPKEPSSSGWYGWLTGSSPAAVSPTTPQGPLADWDDQFQKIYEKFEFEVAEYKDEDSFPFDSIRSQISCRLNSGSFTLRKLCREDMLDAKELVMVKFEGLLLNQVNYPKSSSTVEVKMHHLVVSEPGNPSVFQH